jgi:hypothetical protein
MIHQDSPTWKAWGDFCNFTGREVLWGDSVSRLLTHERVLPCDYMLEVGCGTGEFLSTLRPYAKRVMGIDPNDYREDKSFNFEPISIENYVGEAPDVILYKQVFHLLSDPFEIVARFPMATIVILQIPVGRWDGLKNPTTSATENRIKLNKLGYNTCIVGRSLKLSISKSAYRKLILDGYTSELQKLSVSERWEIWEQEKKNYSSTFVDTLDILIATPPLK